MIRRLLLAGAAGALGYGATARAAPGAGPAPISLGLPWKSSPALG
jgi:hypothetical protein